MDRHFVRRQRWRSRVHSVILRCGGAVETLAEECFVRKRWLRSRNLIRLAFSSPSSTSPTTIFPKEAIMTRGEPIVISDSDSDTLSESERPRVQETSQTKSKAASTSRPPAPQLAKEPPAAEEPTASTSHEALSESGPYTNAATSATGLLSLLPDRRQLELERKERARKRKQQQNLPSTSSDEEEAETSAKRTKQIETHADSRAKPALWSEEARATNEAQPTPQPMGIRTAPATPSSSGSKFSRATDPIKPQSRFWRGTIKHGFNAYADKAASGVTISQMLLPATASSRHGLQLAVLATYDLRMDWLYSLFPKGLPVTLILPPPKEDYRTDPSVARPGLHRSEIFGDFARCPGWQICVPSKPKGGWLTQHMKFLILVHPDFLRVAILSGNLNGIDWERIENTAYIQDFPLNTDTAKAATPAHGSSQGRTNDFKAQLVRILRSLGMPSSHPVYAALDRHDFSQATRARIVASWPEASNLAEWDRMETQGLGRLGKVVRDLGIQPKRSGSLQLECQGSSLANHDIKWIEHFHLLASGFNPRGLLPFKGKTNDPHPEYFKAAGSKSGSLPPIKICFPSQRYVEETTVEGPLGAMSFFGKAETFAASP